MIDEDGFSHLGLSCYQTFNWAHSGDASDPAVPAVLGYAVGAGPAPGELLPGRAARVDAAGGRAGALLEAGQRGLRRARARRHQPREPHGTGQWKHWLYRLVQKCVY